MTARTRRVPAAFADTNDIAPGPAWQSMHFTFACDPTSCATNSGCITVWHTCPQNATESMYSTPRYAAIETITTFASVRRRTIAAVARCVGLPRSIRGHDPGHRPTAKRMSPNTNAAGRTRKNRTPRYGFVCRPNRSAKKTARNSTALTVVSTAPVRRSTGLFLERRQIGDERVDVGLRE